MFTVGMDVDTQVSFYDESYRNVQGYMLETSLYVVMIYGISCPKKFNQANFSQMRPYYHVFSQMRPYYHVFSQMRPYYHVRGTISTYCFKNNQQETYIAQNIALKQTQV
jgi:hypothetical protein